MRDETSSIFKPEVRTKDKWYTKIKICKSFTGKCVTNWFFKKYMYTEKIHTPCYNIKIHIEYFTFSCDDDDKWRWKRITLAINVAITHLIHRQDVAVICLRLYLNNRNSPLSSNINSLRYWYYTVTWWKTVM